MFNWFRQSSKSAPRIVPRAVAIEPPPAPGQRSLAQGDIDEVIPGAPQLSSQAQRVLLRMPANARPLRCTQEHPWMLDRLLATWETPATFRRQLNDLLIDSRGNRQGFSFDTLAELSALGDYYNTHVNPLVDSWATVDPR